MVFGELIFTLSAFLGLLTSGVARGQVGVSARSAAAVAAAPSPPSPLPAQPAASGAPDPSAVGSLDGPDVLLDARNDIVDIRRGRMPLRNRALGWTAEGAFVFRVTDCQAPTESGAPECLVRLVVAAPGKPPRSHILFAQWWGQGDRAGCTSTDMGWPTQPFCWIDQAQASQFLATERALRLQLGALSLGEAQPRPFRLGERRLALDTSEDPQDRDALVRLVAVTGRDVRVLDVPMRQHPCEPDDAMCSSSTVVDRAQILAVHEAPDGRSIAVVMRFGLRMGRVWSGTGTSVGVYSVPPQASAN